MDRWTSALEFLGIILIITAVGVWVAEYHGPPLGLLTAGCLTLLASWLLQGARLPRPGRGKR